MVQKSCITYCPEDSDCVSFEAYDPQERRNNEIKHTIPSLNLIENAVFNYSNTFPTSVFLVWVRTCSGKPPSVSQWGVGVAFSAAKCGVSVLPAGLSCHADQVVNTLRHNTGWQIHVFLLWINMSKCDSLYNLKSWHHLFGPAVLQFFFNVNTSPNNKTTWIIGPSCVIWGY